MITKETLRRTARTFLQSLFGSLAVALPTVDWASDWKHGVLFVAVIPAISSALAAVMNLEG